MCAPAFMELQECFISQIYSALKRLFAVVTAFPCERMFSKQDRLFVKRMMK